MPPSTFADVRNPVNAVVEASATASRSGSLLATSRVASASALRDSVAADSDSAGPTSLLRDSSDELLRVQRRAEQTPAPTKSPNGLRTAMIVTPAILGVLVLAILGYFAYSFLRRRAEQRRQAEVPTPFLFGGTRRAIDLMAELPGGSGDPAQQQEKAAHSPRVRRGRRRRGGDEKVRPQASPVRETDSAVHAFFAPQVATRRPSVTMPGQPQPVAIIQTVGGKELDPFEAMVEQPSPNTPATKRSRPPPAPIDSALNAPADAGAGVSAGIVPFTPLPQYPTSARSPSEDDKRTRPANPPVTSRARRLQLRVVNSGNKSRSSTQTHSTNPSISKDHRNSASTGASGVYEPPTYTRPPSYANSHASNSSRGARADRPPMVALLQLIGAGRHNAPNDDSGLIASPVSLASGGPALRDSGLFPSSASTGDFKTGHQSRKSYASTRRSLASIQDVQAVPGPSSRPMTPPVPALPPASPPISFMMQDPLPGSRRVSTSSSRRQSKRVVRAKGQASRALVPGASSSSTPISAHPQRTSMMSEMDITSLRGLAASSDAASLSRMAHFAQGGTADAKSVRSVDVTSLYNTHHGNLTRRDSSSSSDGVPAIPPLLDHMPFEFDIGFGGIAHAQPDKTSATSTSPLSSPRTGLTPFPMAPSELTTAMSDVAERDPWASPLQRTDSVISTSDRRVRRKPVPSEASFTSYGSETLLLKGKDRSESAASP